MAIPLFNVRVYGILQRADGCVLVADEFIRGEYFTKFPGGGLEFGEGTRDCLKREFKEETNLDVTIGEHIYTTDFFQMSAFNKSHQIISIYYYVHTNEPIQLETKEKAFDFVPAQIADPNGESEVFRWIPWNEFTSNTVNLPIDKVVVDLLKKQ
jgi:8-oxo-dGTP pyrophosphatase MutT (NUDIX family)